MSVPMRAASCSRIACALPGTPLARSSITRSIAETAKVTPAALTHCRSTGASSFTLDSPAFDQAVFKTQIIDVAQILARPARPFHFSSSTETVGAVLRHVEDPSFLHHHGRGAFAQIDAAHQHGIAPILRARGNVLLVMIAFLQLDLQGIANVVGGDARAFLGRPPGRGVQLDIEMAAPVDGFEIGRRWRESPRRPRPCG